jgi:rhodanese-related sulfurtransferase
MPYVLVDLRESAATAGGVVPGAVSIPAADLAGARDQFPKQKSAPVILYGLSAADMEKAFATVRGWGYKNASILTGGLDAWVKAGQKLDAKALEKITYVPKPRPGEISVEEFRTAAAGGAAVVLDVRESGETSAGTLSGALVVPLAELGGRMDELPKDKKIIAHCSTGARAEMAYNQLSEAGYDVKWLNAKVTVKADGSYQVEKD